MIPASLSSVALTITITRIDTALPAITCSMVDDRDGRGQPDSLTPQFARSYHGRRDTMGQSVCGRVAFALFAHTGH